MVFNIIVGLIMAVAFVGMIICAKKQYLNAVAKPAAILLLVVVVICAVTILVHNTGNGDASTLLANEMQYEKASTYMLGKEIAKMHPGAKVLLIVDAIKEKNMRQKAMIEGFKEGCSSSISEVKVVAPEVKRQPGPEMMQVATADSFNKLLAKNKGYKVIFTTIGLPYDAANLKIFKEFDKNPRKCPKLALTGGSSLQLAPLIQAGLLEVIVAYRPDAKFNDDNIPEKMEDLFNERYILVTKQNLKDVKKKYPGRVFSKK